ncbi:TylF/MycF/NovP-related O-methyltransferase [Geodermatophilus sp. SYSU D00691]
MAAGRAVTRAARLPAVGRLRSRVRSVLRSQGVDVRRWPPALPPHIDADAAATITAARPFTMTSVDALFSLVEATRYLVRRELPGAFVECGVWRGGSMVAVARTLLELGVTDRDLWLYDTFEGMTEPADRDVLLSGDRAPAADLLAASPVGDGDGIWCYSTLDQVRAAMTSTGYPADRVHYVAGPVEETIPGRVPDRIALLRLDTDWYESTRHELRHLVPLMPAGGVLIVDDYWYWEGCRQAVDEYLAETGLPLLLTPVHITGVAVLPRTVTPGG